MAKTFDATLKYLEDQFGRRTGLRVLSHDAWACHRAFAPSRSTPICLSPPPQADKLFRLSGSATADSFIWSWNPPGPARSRIGCYCTASCAEHRHGGPVYSVRDPAAAGGERGRRHRAS